MYSSDDNKELIKKKEFYLEDYPDIEDNNNPLMSSASESCPEKPYYQPKEIVKTETKKENKIYSCYRHLIKYIDNLGEYENILLKTFFLLIIQFIIIFFFTLLGFTFDINKSIMESKGAKYGLLIPIIIIILFMCYSALCINDSDRDNPWLYLYLIVYVPCIVFFCFLISDGTDNVNVLCGLILFIVDILAFIIIILIFGKIYYIFFSVLSAVFTVIILLIFHYYWIKDGLITFKISTVGLSEIIYLIIITIFSITKVKEYLFEAIVFDLGIFSPVAAILFIILLIIIFMSVTGLDGLFDLIKK